MILTILLFVFGNLFIFYSIAILIVDPGTFLDNLTAFSNIWAIAGILMLLAACYRIKNNKSIWSGLSKRIRKVITAVLSVIGFVGILNLVLILTPSKVDMTTESDFIILLGGGIDKNGKLPAPVLKRIDKTAEYMKAHPDTICIVTGGTLKWLPYPEAPEMKHQLVKKGIPINRIYVEDQALDTIQNFQYSAYLLQDELGLSKRQILNSRIVIVTSDYHLRRAEILAKRMGFKNIKGIGARTTPFFVPMNYLREICAYVKLSARIVLTGKPNEQSLIIQ